VSVNISGTSLSAQPGVVRTVDDKHVHLTLTADEAKAAWREKH
jgi:hypothetical protein